MEPKRITDDKHAIILQSHGSLQRKGDLIISSQKLLGLKDMLLTYLRKALQKLNQHFVANRCQVAWFLNAQSL